MPLLKADPGRTGIKAHTLPDAALAVPLMCNLGTKEGVTVKGDRFGGVWPANELFFNTVRGKGGLVGVAVDPLTSHECGNQRYLAIPWLDACLTEAFAIAVDECDGVFLSVDIDVCDPGHAPGTGTPEPGGLTARQLLDAVRRVCLELPVVGIDVVEVSPPYDHADITAALANRVVLESLCAIARRRADAAGEPSWDPGRPLLEGRGTDGKES